MKWKNKESFLRTQYKKNVLSIWANRLLLMIIPLITMPLILNSFGLEKMGIWLLACQILSYVALLDGGLINSLVRVFAKSEGHPLSGTKAQVAATGFYFLSAISALLLLATPLIVSYISVRYKFPSIIREDAIRLFYLAFVVSAISMPLKIGFGLLGGTHRFDLIQYIDGAGALVKLILIVVFFNFYCPSLFVLGLVVFGTSLGTNFFTYFIAVRKSFNNFFSFNNFSIKVLGGLISLSFSAFFVTLSAAILFQGSVFAVGKIIDLQSVVLLALPIMLLNTMSPFFTTFSVIVAPVAAKVSTLKDKKDLLNSFLVTTRYIFIGSTFMLAAFYLFGKTIFNFWLLGQKIHSYDIEIIYKSTVILMLGFSIGSVAVLGRSILISVGKHWEASLVELFTSILGVAAGVALVKFYELNIYGMVWGIFICFALRGLYFYPKMIAAFFGISSFSLLFQCKIKPFLIFFLSFFFFVALKYALVFLICSESRIINGICYFISFNLFALLGWKFLLIEKHKRIITKKFQRITL